MTRAPLDLPFTDANGHQHLLHAFTTTDGEWDVQTEVDGNSLARHCRDWTRVERFREWLEVRTQTVSLAPAHRMTGER